MKYNEYNEDMKEIEKYVSENYKYTPWRIPLKLPKYSKRGHSNPVIY